MRCFGSLFKTRRFFKSFGAVGIPARGIHEARARAGMLAI